MQKGISDDLINISTMLMVAHDRGEIVKLAAELNGVIVKALDMEKTGALQLPQEKKKTLSATIKFTKQEIDKMSKTFKKEFIANGCVAHIIKRQSGKKSFYYEIRYRRNGYNITVSSKDVNTAKKLFVEATSNLSTPETLQKNKYIFGTIANQWLDFKKNKVILSTWKDHNSLINRFVSDELRRKQITDIHTNDIETILNNAQSERLQEELRSLFNQIFKFAIANGIITHNPVTLIPFKRAKRTNRKALTEEQVKTLLMRIKEPQFNGIRQFVYVMYFFGARPCEIDEEAHFDKGFLVCRNRKRKDGKIEYKKIPIPEQAREFIDFNKPLISEYSQDKTIKIFKTIFDDTITPYNLRHTFATICAETVKAEVLDIWMGDSPERLVERTYVHYKDKYMIEQMKTVKFIT